MSELLLTLHEKREMVALSAELWGVITAAQGGTSAPLQAATAAAGGGTITPQQVRMLGAVEEGLVAAVRQLSPDRAEISGGIPGGSQPATTTTSALARAAAHALSASSPAASRSVPLVTDAATALVGGMQQALDLASPALIEAFDSCRKQLATPPPELSGDVLQLAVLAQQRVGSLLLPVTSRVLDGLAPLCHAVAAAALAGANGVGLDLAAGGASGPAPAAAQQQLLEQLGRVMVQVRTTATHVFRAGEGVDGRGQGRAM